MVQVTHARSSIDAPNTTKPAPSTTMWEMQGPRDLVRLLPNARLVFYPRSEVTEFSLREM
jgi:hypothetical protein